jgi:predicted ester cyclase
MHSQIILAASFAAALLSVPASLHGQASLASAKNTVTPEERIRAIEKTRAILEAYWTNHDPRYVAEDAVFTMLPTGEEIRGRDAIAKHLEEFYHGSFTAHAEVVNGVFSENEGLLEALVVGTHTGVFGGIPATGRSIRVPLAVAYELEGGLIKRARIYLMANVLFDQIKPAPKQ